MIQGIAKMQATVLTIAATVVAMMQVLAIAVTIVAMMQVLARLMTIAVTIAVPPIVEMKHATAPIAGVPMQMEHAFAFGKQTIAATPAATIEPILATAEFDFEKVVRLMLAIDETTSMCGKPKTLAVIAVKLDFVHLLVFSGNQIPFVKQ